MPSIDTGQLIEDSFRSILTQKRFRSITVKEICERAGVSRKVFYAHFDSKDAIVDVIFKRDVLKSVFDLGHLLSNDELIGLSRSVFERMFKAVYDDRDYYRALVFPMRGNDFTFLEITSSSLYDLYSRMLVRLGQSNTLRQSEYVASYFSTAHAEFLQKWICDDFPIPPEKLTEIFVAMALPFWRTLAGK